MARNLDTTLKSHLEDRNTYHVVLAYMEFSSGALALHSGLGNLTVGAVTYTGAGNLLFIEELHETSNLDANGITVGLSAIPSEYISKALESVTTNNVCRLYWGLTDNAGTLYGSPYQFFKGFVETSVINKTGDGSAIIGVRLQNELAELERAKQRRYTHHDQQIDYPDDKGLEFVSELQNKEIEWEAG